MIWWRWTQALSLLQSLKIACEDGGTLVTEAGLSAMAAALPRLRHLDVSTRLSADRNHGISTRRRAEGVRLRGASRNTWGAAVVQVK